MLVPFEGARDEGNASIQTFCCHSGLFDQCVISLHKMLLIVHSKLSMLTKETINHRPLRRVRKAPQIIVTNVPNRKYFRWRLAGDFLQVANF